MVIGIATSTVFLYRASREIRFRLNAKRKTAYPPTVEILTATSNETSTKLAFLTVLAQF